jgi:hydrogenase-4 membrane subunit HyfE
MGLIIGLPSLVLKRLVTSTVMRRIRCVCTIEALYSTASFAHHLQGLLLLLSRRWTVQLRPSGLVE